MSNGNICPKCPDCKGTLHDNGKWYKKPQFTCMSCHKFWCYIGKTDTLKEYGIEPLQMCPKCKVTMGVYGWDGGDGLFHCSICTFNYIGLVCKYQTIYKRLGGK